MLFGYRIFHGNIAEHVFLLIFFIIQNVVQNLRRIEDLISAWSAYIIVERAENNGYNLRMECVE